MKKNYIEFEGKKYLAREIDLSPILDGYGTTLIGCNALSMALHDATDDFTIENQDANDIDNEIYCYLESGVLECDPTDAELLLEVMRVDGIDTFADKHWYNLMRIALCELADWYHDGKTLVTIGGYEYGGNYRVNIYQSNVVASHYIYDGRNAQSAAMAIMSALITIRLMQL